MKGNDLFNPNDIMIVDLYIYFWLIIDKNQSKNHLPEIWSSLVN